MQSQAYFTEIQKHITTELKSALNSVYLAVAWFTDPILLTHLERLKKSGGEVAIILIDDEINKGAYGLDFTSLKELGGKVLFIKSQENKRTLMHNKFCIIDNSILITGSYNWSKSAQRNHENIVIIRNDQFLVNEFILEFNSLIKIYSNNNVLKKFPLDYRKIIIRLGTIQNAILLEDEEDIRNQVEKLETLIPSTSDQNGYQLIKNIITALKGYEYSLANGWIETFLKQLRQIKKYESPNVQALKLEEKNLKYQIILLENEKVEIIKLTRHFEIKHDKILGTLILKILKTQKENAEAKDSAEAEEKYNTYKENYNINRGKEINQLNEQEKIVLKKLFRKAAILCHPDKVPEAFHQNASKAYMELTEAYEQNNLQKVEVILENLKNGTIKLEDEEKADNELKKLKAKTNYLRLRRDELTKELIKLKESKTFLTISIIENWDEYFIEQKEKLELQLELITMKHDG